MPDLWYRCFHRLCTWLYFERVTVVHGERLPGHGPVLYLGLHRNGAVDGFIYNSVLPAPTFMISTQLRKNFLARIFFNGFAVTRCKDEGDRSINVKALQQCLDHLRNGGELFVFPEGTSSLGPRHLPFKSGAAQLLQEYLEKVQRPISVVPVGIHYECAWAFRSKVEVVIRGSIDTQLSPELSPLGRLKELKRRIQAGLEEVGVNVGSADYQEKIQTLACASTLAAPHSYFASLKNFETTIPAHLEAAWNVIEPQIRESRLLHHQGVPLFPMQSVWLYLALLLLLTPLVALAMAINGPPLLAAWWAGQKFPDGRNVVSLWRILVGVPLLLLWWTTLVMGFVFVHQPLLGAVSAIISWAGLKSYYRVKKLGVAVQNQIRHPEMRARLIDFRRLILASLPQ